MRRAGFNEATMNMAKSATFYDVTIEPAGKYYDKQMETAANIDARFNKGDLGPFDFFGGYINQMKDAANQLGR